MRKPPLRSRLASKLSTEGAKAIGVKRSPTSKVNFYSEGGDTMATKKPSGFKPFEKKSDMKMEKKGDKKLPAFLMKGKPMKKGGKAKC